VSQRGVSAGRGGAGLKRGSLFSGSEVSKAGSTSGSAFVRRHPNREAVSATTPIDTAAPRTTNGTTEFRRLRPMDRSLARWTGSSNWPIGQIPNSPARGDAGRRRGSDACGVRLVIATLAAWGLVVAPAQACGADRPSDKQAWRVELLGRTGVSAAPGGAVRRSITPAQAGALLVLSTRSRGGACWLQVRLPSRPNLAKGWVDAERVQPLATPWRIEVALRSRTVTLLRGGARVARYRAVVGAPGTPTPRGLFALVEAYPNPASDFLGRWVVTLTAHSDVLQHYEGGDGRVAIHGRGGDSLQVPLGSAASHGCVRLTNAAISSIVRRIGEAAIPGVPVRIR